MKTLVSLLLLLAPYAFVSAAHGQECEPAELDYIVRDKKGRRLGEAALQTVSRQMSKPAATVNTVPFAGDGSVARYSSEKVKTKLPVLSFVDSGRCELGVGEMTLRYAGKTMRLIFNLNINRKSYVIDSVPFQTGTFELDQKGLSEARVPIVPAKRWKKISSKP